MLQAWLDGTYLGQNVLGTNLAAAPPTTGTATLTVPAALRDHRQSRPVRDGPQRRPQRGRRE
jgi:hypothetical protein